MAKFKIEDLPKGDFHFKDIADRFYPECISSDSEGRVYNKSSSTVVRILRKMKLILELQNGYFYNGS